jgi:hypothetical protein
MTDAPTDKKLSERFAEFVQAWKDGGDPHEDANTILRMGRFAIDRSDTILRALCLAESHPSAIREAVEQEREAIAEIADEDAMNIRSQIRKVSESDVVNSIDAAAKWNRATALEDFAFCVRARTKDEANG